MARFLGDARFAGSTGNMKLNAPVRSLVPDGSGYWLVATDGGAFAGLNDPLRGRLPDGRRGRRHLQLSNQPFAGSLGANPPRRSRSSP